MEFETNVSSCTIIEPRLKNDGAQLVHETITSVSMHLLPKLENKIAVFST